jgi:argininosuccinate synthase
MQMLSLIDSLDGLEERLPSSCVLLYSGGIDGSYFLDWASCRGLDVLALNVGLEGAGDRSTARGTAALLGVDYLFEQKTEEFAVDFVSPAIKANAYYQGLYPVCSSLSRPLMAKTALDVARTRGIATIVHTSTYMQNSAFRLTMSIAALDQDVHVAAPFLRSQVAREEKRRRLCERGLTFPTGIYSIDQNLWGRVIECGSLENPENDLPSTGVFQWSSDIVDTPEAAEVVEIEFRDGLPIAVDGRHLGLVDIISTLNRLGGRHGIGRFSGLEDITFGGKNHEVREAPAAQLLITAHRELESAILTQTELSLKLFLDNQWVNLIVGGFWYSELVRAIGAFIDHMSTLIHGRVRLRLYRGNVTVLAKEAATGLYYAGFHEEFEHLMAQVSFPAAYALLGLPLIRRRTVGWSAAAAAGTP